MSRRLFKLKFGQRLIQRNVDVRMFIPISVITVSGKRRATVISFRGTAAGKATSPANKSRRLKHQHVSSHGQTAIVSQVMAILAMPDAT
jgi:hypothetical protein